MLKIAYNKIFRYKLDENHRFPMEKYDLIPEQLINEEKSILMEYQYFYEKYEFMIMRLGE